MSILFKIFPISSSPFSFTSKNVDYFNKIDIMLIILNVDYFKISLVFQSNICLVLNYVLFLKVNILFHCYKVLPHYVK